MGLRSKLLALAAVATALLCTAVAQPPAAPDSGGPTEAQIRSAVLELRKDPELAWTRKIHVLAWAKGPPTTGWVQGFFTWVGESARWVIWVACTIAAGVLVIYLTRLVQQRPAPARDLSLPTHVQDLDIRPESLPADVAAAALALWEQGEHRAALALLYRGALSRLVHAHGVPIRDSSTEGDCEQLAAARLSPPQMAYVSRLIRAWQAAVYGGSPPAPQTFRGLCVELGPMLDRAGAGPAPQPA